MNNRDEKKYVKTILFTARADSIYVRMNPLSKFVILLLISVGVVLSMDRPVPDLYYNLGSLAFAFIFLLESGTLKYLVRSYLVMLLIALGVMLLWWLVFNQTGTNPIFSIGSGWFHFQVTPLSIYVGTGKVSGYAAMSFLTLLTVMTTRDADIISALRNIRIPFKVVFFISIVSRSLNILSDDLETIRQAQISRGGRLRSGGIIGHIREFIMLAVPLTVSIIRRSVEVGAAMEARGFGKVKNFTGFIDEKGFKWYDGALLAFGTVMLLIPLLLKG
ncbi:MAG: energy-coupling factor transporter transmembrane protein EcfT [Candidatus Thermoplasmatota archaeon]|nr:energy-coupling factor transporter transmembrane protein EcfT [Candidatus Thermoplasmatota archaeon]